MTANAEIIKKTHGYLFLLTSNGDNVMSRFIISMVVMLVLIAFAVPAMACHDCLSGKCYTVSQMPPPIVLDQILEMAAITTDQILGVDTYLADMAAINSSPPVATMSRSLGVLHPSLTVREFKKLVAVRIAETRTDFMDSGLEVTHGCCRSNVSG